MTSDNTFASVGPMQNLPEENDFIKIAHELYEKNAELVLQNRILETLSKIYEIINIGGSSTEVFLQLTNQIRNELNYEAALLYVWKEATRCFEPESISCTETLQRKCGNLRSDVSPFKIEQDKIDKVDILTRAVRESRRISTSEGNELLKIIFSTKNENVANEINEFKYFLIQPVVFATKVIAVFVFATESTINPLTNTVEKILDKLLNVLAIGIQNIKLNSQIRSQLLELTHKNTELHTIGNVTNEVVTVLDPKIVAERATNVIPRELGYQAVMVFEVEDGTQKFVALTSENINENLHNILLKVRKVNWELNQRSSSSFAMTDKLSEVLGGEISDEEVQLLENNHSVKSCVIVPMRAHDEVKGIMIFFRHKTTGEITTEEYDLMQTLANQVATGFDNAKLFSQYQQLNISLEEKNTTLREYAQKERDILDIMGHELRTPITIARNAVSLLKKEHEDPQFGTEQRRHYLTIASTSINREINIIETMLSATKVESGNIQLSKNKVDFKEVLEETLLALREDATQKALEIQIDIPEDLPKVFADRSRFQEIINNLVSNAIKYTQHGYVKIVAREVDQMLQISVEDSGIGIPEEAKEHLGTKFYRVAQHVAEGTSPMYIVRPGGTGLGLFVTYNLVKIHGGEIRVESEVGKGTKFIFTIPKYTNQTIDNEAANTKDLMQKIRQKVVDKNSQDAIQTNEINQSQNEHS